MNLWISDWVPYNFPKAEPGPRVLEHADSL